MKICLKTTKNQVIESFPIDYFNINCLVESLIKNFESKNCFKQIDNKLNNILFDKNVF